MNRNEILSGIVVLAIAVLTLACTWAPLTPEGRSVRVLRASEVTGCLKVGKATAQTREQVVNFARSDRKVREELESLGRNEGAELGGDAIVPVGNPAGGRQSFDVYRCRTPSDP